MSDIADSRDAYASKNWRLILALKQLKNNSQVEEIHVLHGPSSSIPCSGALNAFYINGILRVLAAIERMNRVEFFGSHICRALGYIISH